MLTVAYCRVSSEEQATEGYSIDGQADKLRSYAGLHDLGDVTVIADPGRSGKDTDRPGLQQLLAMVERGHVDTVLVWRLDRLSRNLGDLVLLADTFGRAGVALHSFTEKLDLSSATGRMFYNILGSFAQFYREQLGENVRLGLQQAVKQGKWPNRPKLGYSRLDGTLVPNDDAPVVRRIFKLRADGASYRAIEQDTDVSYSTVHGILRSRIYLGETLYRGEWYPGEHEPILTEAEWQAAHRGHVPGRRRGKQLLSGRVRCGLCGRLAAVEYHPKGFGLFRCRHRGQGCPYPRRRATGLEQAATLGLRLIGRDPALQDAIRRQLEMAGARGGSPDASHTHRQRNTTSIAEFERNRRKLLDLYYAEGISAELFASEEQQLTVQLEAARAAADEQEQSVRRDDALTQRFEEVVTTLADLDIDAIWQEATEQEKRVLVEEMVEQVSMYPDHLEVVVAGAPPLTVTLEEVGLQGMQTVGASGGTRTPTGRWAHWDLNPARLPIPPRSRDCETYR
jgi:site-specific DNA recombinase